MSAISFAWFVLVLGLLRVARVHAETVPPPVISPKSSDEWTVGAVATVKWLTEGYPVYQSDNKTPLVGDVFLSRLTNSSVSGLQIWSQQPLVHNVPLVNQQAQVVVPNVPTGHSYFITFVGANNRGPVFTIINPQDPNGTGAVPSSLAVSTIPFGTSTPGASATSAGASGTTTASGATSMSPSSSASSAPTATQSGGAVRVGEVGVGWTVGACVVALLMF
ncbi:hypothetical protein BD413DRAFT_186913 [Trametes elegans]|nr:hypothetical protein BD413DRAFT_186913 [Trametes elegans]